MCSLKVRDIFSALARLPLNGDTSSRECPGYLFRVFLPAESLAVVATRSCRSWTCKLQIKANSPKAQVPNSIYIRNELQCVPIRQSSRSTELRNSVPHSSTRRNVDGAMSWTMGDGLRLKFGLLQVACSPRRFIASVAATYGLISGSGLQ